MNTEKIELFVDQNYNPVDKKNAVFVIEFVYVEDIGATKTIKKIKNKEAVTLVGPHPVAQIKKKKRHFEFKENLDEHWESLLNEARFRAFTHSSSFVGNVKYDQDNQTMEIILNGKKYDFCNVSERLFDAFEGADSKGAFFNREIKSLHDC